MIEKMIYSRYAHNFLGQSDFGGAEWYVEAKTDQVGRKFYARKNGFLLHKSLSRDHKEETRHWINVKRANQLLRRGPT
jgi:hypothetical protein